MHDGIDCHFHVIVIFMFSKLDKKFRKLSLLAISCPLESHLK